jgi:acetoacetate decarboxylase
MWALLHHAGIAGGYEFSVVPEKGTMETLSAGDGDEFTGCLDVSKTKSASGYMLRRNWLKLTGGCGLN